jgi:hypothetical protein
MRDFMFKSALLGFMVAGVSVSTASADSIQFHHPATFVPADQSFDGIQYWITPWGYRDQQTLWLACAPGTLRVDAIENRISDTYDSLSFNGNIDVRSPDGWWFEYPTNGLSLKSPWLGGVQDSWWVVRVTGSGSFRPCDYVDPDRKSTRRCYPIVHFTVDTSDWAWVYYAGNGTWPWPWQPAMRCSAGAP